MPIRKVLRTPPLEAEILKREKDFKIRLLKLEADDWPWPESEEFEIEAIAFDALTDDLERIAKAREPLNELTLLFTDKDGNKFYESATEKWSAFYFLNEAKEAVVVCDIRSAKSSRKQLAAELKAKLKEYESGTS